jgi:hypothetical protein
MYQKCSRPFPAIDLAYDLFNLPPRRNPLAPDHEGHRAKQHTDEDYRHPSHGLLNASRVILIEVKNLGSNLGRVISRIERDVGKPGLMLRISLRRFTQHGRATLRDEF